MKSLGRLAVLVFLFASACSIGSAKKHYVLAEKLWSDGKYAASVTEFEKVTANDPRGRLGLQALYRAAMTQTLFLGQHAEAVRKFRAFVDARKELGNNTDLLSAWEAEKQIGEILFSKMEQYEQAARHYRQMLQERPEAPESPEFLFRVGKSEFYLWQFSEALETYRNLIQRFPKTAWAEKAAFEIGTTYFTRGEQKPEQASGGSSARGKAATPMESYQQAIQAFQNFLQNYPKSALVSEARFGIASCYEEMDQLDAAYQIYQELLNTYPSPNVIKIKMARIQERKIHRRR